MSRISKTLGGSYQVHLGIREVLDSGAHRAGKTRRWNPKMRRYVFGKRNRAYIIDLQKTLRLFREAAEFVFHLGRDGGNLLFVGTKSQAQKAMLEEAKRCGQFYIIHRWLGGTLTNFATIRNSVERLKEIEAQLDFVEPTLIAKERLRLDRERQKLNRNLSGIRSLEKLPDALFVVDPKKESIAVAEANKLNIPVIGLSSYNLDPELVDYAIPGNDEVAPTIRLFASKIADSYLAGTGKLAEIRKSTLGDRRDHPSSDPQAENPELSRKLQSEILFMAEESATSAKTDLKKTSEIVLETATQTQRRTERILAKLDQADIRNDYR